MLKGLRIVLASLLAMVVVACGGGGGGGTPPAATHTVVYDGNGHTAGTVPVDAGTYMAGDSVLVAGNSGALTRDGYLFDGWNTAADGGGITYAPGQTFTMGGGDVTLYARWTPTHAVLYDGNGNTTGKAPVDPNAYAQGQMVTVAGNSGALVKAGYTFVGWNTRADGKGTTYSQGQTFAMGGSDVTLYARWTANPVYGITYDGNGNTGGSVPADSSKYEQGQQVTVLDNSGALVKSGYSFAGWNTQANGTGTSFVAAQSFAMGNADVTLYAMWTANPTYTITYDGNGSTGGAPPTDNTHYEQGVNVPVLGNTGNLVKAGSSFSGWNTRQDGTGPTYTGGQSFAMGGANVTLYAVWTVDATYTVTYDGNGNTGGIVPVDATSYVHGQTVTVLGNTGALARNGYTFVDWNTQADALGTFYAPADTFAMGSANVTLYAMWSPVMAVKISQIYAWGGLAGATYNRDYVELFNPGALSIDMTGWSLQYASAGNLFSWSYAFPPGSVVQPGRYLLIAMGTAGANGSALPSADLTPGTAQDMSTSGGKLALVHNATLLSCGTAVNRCGTPVIEDMVGYGVTASDYEGAAAATAPTAATSALFRAANGCTDTNDNSADFLTASPNPRNAMAAASLCW